MNTTQMGSFQTPMGTRSATLLDTSCGYLLQELQMIWDEVGEDEFEREKVLLDLEQECLEVYRRKVDSASISRARLHQELAKSEAEFTHLLLSLGERSLPGRPEKMTGTLKEQLDSISPALREMQLRKDERVKQFQDVQRQIQEISAEIAGESESSSSETEIQVNENDLSLKKLEEYQTELQTLQNEKNDRLQRVETYLSTVRSLSAILGMDSSTIITKVHPSLNKLSGHLKNISDGILAKLNSTVESLEEEKHMRLKKLHHLGKALKNLWSLMDTSFEERHLFSHIISLLSVSSAEISAPESLTLDIIQQADAEVKRLDQLKASKMKELFFKKQFELETICSRSHMGIPSRSEMEHIVNLIHSGEIDHSDLLMSMDDQIAKAKDEAQSRQIIMEKVEKWMSAREEEHWLEEYSKDENRYSVSRGAHKNLRRAERARVMVNRIPALVESLIAKTREWERERNKVFIYDEVSLLAMLEEYYAFRHEKEEENRRQREKKKVPSHVVTEPRPSTSSRRISDRSINGGFGNASPQNRRVSLGMSSINSASQGTSFIREGQKENGQKKFARPAVASHVKDDTASVVSTFSGPLSP